MNGEKINATKVGLVLTGGGARAAYQVGVLRAISDIIKVEKNPFAIITGLSAGAINGSWLASRCESFDNATQSMWNTWATITADQIYNTDTISLMRIALRWIKDRGLGGLQKYSQINYLLDTSPLDRFIRRHINFDHLNQLIETNELYGFSIIAVDYNTGRSTAFYNGNKQIQDWKKFNRISIRTKISPEYVLASSAIPIFFPPVKIGNSFYGDGMVRMHAPLSPAIHLGADKLMVIGGRGPREAVPVNKINSDTISLGEISGAILNGLFFDSLDADIDRMQRINRTLSILTKDKLQQLPDNLRKIPILNLKPSVDLSKLSKGSLGNLPYAMSYLLRGIGVTENKGKDLLSFLSFDSKYITSLLELGYQDTERRKDQVLDFFET